LLLAESGAVLGYALVLFRRDSRAARLYSLAVKPGSSGRGIGSQLLAAAEGAARDRGAALLRLEVRADNADALRFYESHGYVLFGRRDEYYADGMAALRLQRALAVVGRSGSTAPRPEPLEAGTDG
jgi:ribosomal protein S18 acetylase RimI-like enzyme